jgi:redox-sensitive bicupin YhaK (pirin superfamily)
MLDEFNVNFPAGFPDHPHRGFETVTYMLSGTFEHEDFMGHRGLIGPGDLQWMTAGKGIVHAEMPYSKDPATGLQLWVNLPKTAKLMEPKYQEVLDKDVPRSYSPSKGVQVKVIAGESYGVKAAVSTCTPIYYLDVHMKENEKFEQKIPSHFTGFIYTLQGVGLFGQSKKKAEPHCTLVLSHEGDTLIVETESQQTARFVVIAGQPLHEPVVQHGPFVMNTQEEIHQAFIDYQMGQNGFEKAHEWSSEIGKRRLV